MRQNKEEKLIKNRNRITMGEASFLLYKSRINSEIVIINEPKSESK